ncbi:MAG: hypothetical protein ACM3XR_00865 [Bacillota bacterium]
MQDRYAGDVGDFGKIGLLRQIASTGLKVGINWYRTYKPEEHDIGDGKHIGYLNNKSFQACDDELLSILRQIVKSDRSVAALEKAELIPNAQYYSAILRPGSDKSFNRDVWYKNSMKALADSDIIFCDPDNGLIVKSVSLSSAKSDKYITEDELAGYYLSGKSVVFYNHRCREKEHIYLRRFTPLRMRNELASAKWLGLKFVRGTTRDYLFILQPYHFKQVNGVIERMMQSNWNKHFSILNIDE